VVNSGLFVVPNFVVVQSAVSTAGAADTTTAAPISGLIVFLPLVSAFVGGIVGAWANSWYRNQEAKKARKEEREGLLILLSMEVHTNNRSLETFLKGLAPPDENRANVAATVRSVVWDESKVRLAQLIPGRFLAMLAHYYTRIETLRLQWAGPTGGSSKHDTIRARSIRTNGFTVIREAQDYISDPRFSAPLLPDEDAA
jgi:hypothetical protein